MSYLRAIRKRLFFTTFALQNMQIPLPQLTLVCESLAYLFDEL